MMAAVLPSPLGAVTRDDGGILLATRLAVVRCGCGSIHFQLFGLDGQRFAEAQVPADGALNIAMSIIDEMRSSGDPAAGAH